MAATKKLTENDCLAELERVCKIIAYYGMQDDKDLIFCRKTITSALESLATVRREKAEKAEARKKAKAEAESKRRYGGGY